MHKKILRAALMGTLAACALTQARAAEDKPRATVQALEAPEIAIGDGVLAKAGVRKLTASMGAGANFAFREGRLFLVSDRGPAVACAAAESVGSDVAMLCKGDEAGRAFAAPDFSPMIHQFKLNGKGGFAYEFSLPLRGTKGEAVGGLPNPPLKEGAGETPWSGAGEKLKADPSGVAPEAISRLPDRSFLIGDDNGPSLLHVAADGEILMRWVPEGTEARFKGAVYPVKPALPAALAKAKPEGGLSGVTVSPEGAFAYFVTAAPIGGQGRLLRLHKFDLEAQKTAGVWIYRMENAKGFSAKAEQGQIRAVEMGSLAGEALLLVTESDGARLKTFGVTLEDGAKLPDKLAESLESADDAKLKAAGAEPLAKTLLFDSAGVKGVPARVEGVAVLALDTLLLAARHDSGLGGAEDKPALALVTLAEPLARMGGAKKAEEKTEAAPEHAKEGAKK